MVAKERSDSLDSGGLANQIAGRLLKSYRWIDRDDLEGYAHLGVTMALSRYRADRGVPLAIFAYRKGMFLAIDEMRKDGVLRRRSALPTPATSGLPEEVADPSGFKDHDLVVQRDLLNALLNRLGRTDRQLLMMYYSQYMTFREIAAVFGITESAISLRHKALLARLRRLAGRDNRP